MKLFLEKHKAFLLFVAGFIVAELLVKPLGNFPLNDDWAYAQAVITFNKSGHINFGNFPAMSLCAHIIWGWLFTKLLGFSIFALRVSTFVSAIIGFAFLNKLAVQISGSKRAGILACVILLCNPIFFCMSNTFMTDVNFNTLCILCCYLAYNYFLTRRTKYYVWFIVAASLLILVRQYGIVFPACFVLACFFVQDKKLKPLLLSLLSLVIVVAVLKVYEVYLKHHLPEGGAYKFSGNVHLTKLVFWENLATSFTLKHNEIMQHLLFYTSPMALLFLPGVLRRVDRRILILVGINSFVLTCFFYTGPGLSSANIFSSMMLGPETVLESFSGARHNSYPRFDTFIYFLKMILSLVTLFVAFSALLGYFSKPAESKQHRPELVFLVGLALAYTFMILITESYFDRYHLPLITIGIILFAWLVKRYEVDLRLAVLPLALWAWISVAGTRDYFEWNRQRWSAYWYLTKELHVPKEKINGGFEVNCWADGDGFGWREFLMLDGFNYVIQFNCPPGFKQFREYEFQRYFPFKKDKIYIFAREDQKTTE